MNLSSYNPTIFENVLLEDFNKMEEKVLKHIEHEDVNKTIITINESTDNAYRKAKIKKPKNDELSTTNMVEANRLFDSYRKCVSGEIDDDIDVALRTYQAARSKISKEAISAETKKWKDLTAEKNSKKLWEKIDWKGNLTKEIHQSPIFDDLTVHFEKLYKNENVDDEQNMMELNTDVYIPTLDDPITSNEIETAINEMKKGGFDHRMDMFRIIMKVMWPLILIIMNILFYITYPPKLALSILNALPKKGNLSLAKNYRGIQMLQAFGVLFDRIITNRIKSGCE